MIDRRRRRRSEIGDEKCRFKPVIEDADIQIEVNPKASQSCHVKGRVQAHPSVFCSEFFTTALIDPDQYGKAHWTPAAVRSAVIVVDAMNASQSPSSGTIRSFMVAEVPDSTHVNMYWSPSFQPSASPATARNVSIERPENRALELLDGVQVLMGGRGTVHTTKEGGDDDGDEGGSCAPTSRGGPKIPGHAKSVTRGTSTPSGGRLAMPPFVRFLVRPGIRGGRCVATEVPMNNEFLKQI